MHRRPRQRPIGIRILGALAYLLFCTAIFAIGAAAGWISQSPLGFKGFTTILRPPKVGTPDVFDGRSSINLLILGCDEDLYYGGKQVLLKQARSDMMLVARLDFRQNRISGVSIPRDTLCELPGFREQKINAYHAIGAKKSPELGKLYAKQAVETILPPVMIDRVLVIDYDAFQEMVNLVGGVSLYVDKKMKYTDKAGGLFINFKPGKQHLDGYEAMCFVRYRHGDDDFHRQNRQKEFLMSFKDAMLKNLTALPQVANKAKDAIGGGLTDEEIIALAHFARKVSRDNIKMGVVPVLPADKYNFRVNTAELPSTLAEFHLTDDYSLSTGRVSTLR
jgi:polyisoprenyl-teichoic acid--peptidoglycan teichoic acid transferase